KVDRRALAAPDLLNQKPEQLFIDPRTPVEEAVAGIWSLVLGLEHVSVNANFFDLGGHSLSATRLVSRVRDAFQIELPLSTFFTDGLTVEELSKVIEQYQIEQTSAEEMSGMLA